MINPNPNTTSKLVWWLMTSFAAVVLAFATSYITSNASTLAEHEKRITNVEKTMAVDNAVTTEQLKALNAKLDELLQRSSKH